MIVADGMACSATSIWGVGSLCSICGLACIHSLDERGVCRRAKLATFCRSAKRGGATIPADVTSACLDDQSIAIGLTIGP